MLNKRQALAEGWEDYVIEREIQDAFEDMIHWIVACIDPCCRDCGWLDWAHGQRAKARSRAYLVGAMADQPGEAEWMTAWRYEHSISAVDAYAEAELIRE